MDAIVRQATNPNNALMRLGDQQIACRVKDGFIIRSTRKIRLNFGPELYAAKPGTLPLTEKVTCYQPGYMKVVAAMGGTLTVPPTVRDPVTGQPMANPVVECVPGTSIIRNVKATAVCVVRDAMGCYHASVQTIVVDSEHVLRQALLKLENTDNATVLSDDDIRVDREAGKLRGWIVVPILPGYSVAGRVGAAAVREAIQTCTNLSATIRQRACTKAERLACDHNPGTRMSWAYGELLQDVREKATWEARTVRVADGVAAGWEAVGPAYAEIEVTAWAESRDQAAMAAFVESLASQQHVDGVETIVGESTDAEDTDVDDDPEEAAPRQIAENPVPPKAIQAPKPEPVPVAIPKVEMVREVAVSRDGGPIESGPDTTYSGKPAAPVEASPEVLRLQERCQKLLAGLPDGEVRFARTKSGFGGQEVSVCTDASLLRKFQTELNEVVRSLT